MKQNSGENAGVWKEIEIQQVTEKETEEKEKMCEGGKECGGELNCIGIVAVRQMVTN